MRGAGRIRGSPGQESSAGAVIAGGGILICTVAAFVVLPAVLVVADRRRPGHTLARPLESRWLRALTSKYPVWVTGLSSLAIAGFAAYGTSV